MKIAIALTDQSFARTKSMGIFNVSMGLTKGLMNHPEVSELHILGNNECQEAFANCPPHVHLHLMDKPVPRRFSRVWWDQFGLPAAVRKINPDWLLLPKGFPPFMHLPKRIKLACYVHDVIWEYYQELGKKGQNPFPWYENLYFSFLGKRALRISDLVLTSTRFNAERFIAHVPSANTAVIGIGFDTPTQCNQFKTRGNDILFHVSTFPHKITPLGIKRIQAWLAQQNHQENIKIHCIGNTHDSLIPNSPNWIKHGKVSQEKLNELMTKQCRVAAYFSEYEGFGMPPVESLRCGLPCVASNIPPIRENIPLQYLFDNNSESSFIETMNNAYFSVQAPESPSYPSWEIVTNNCVQAFKNT